MKTRIALKFRLARVLNRVFPTRLSRARHLNPRPDISTRRLRSRRLNTLVLGMGSCHSYLEIGVREGYTLQDVAATKRVGVDPVPQFEFRRNLPRGVRVFPETSDTFFARNTDRFDLIFVDGLHEYEQALRDTLHALEALNSGGLVVVDDTVPVDEFSGEPDEEDALRLRALTGDLRRDWNGDVFKVAAFFTTQPAGVGLVTLWSQDDSDQHGQTVLWKTRAFEFSTLVKEAQAFVAPSYAELFIDGKPPESFNAFPEQHALEVALIESRKAAGLNESDSFSGLA